MKKSLTMKVYCGYRTFDRKFRMVVNSTTVYDELIEAMDFLKCTGNAVEIFCGENSIGYAERLPDGSIFNTVDIA